MAAYREVQNTITVPKGAGVEGYLEAIRKILRRPRVQDVHLKSDGTITYKRFALEEEPEDPITTELETLLPYHILRNITVEEIVYPPDEDVDWAVRKMFTNAAADGLTPIGFTSGSMTPIGGLWTQNSTLYGYPLWIDSNIPSEVLILFGGYTMDSSLLGARKAYKILLPPTTR
jgi:hypothetical protein